MIDPIRAYLDDSGCGEGSCENAIDALRAVLDLCDYYDTKMWPNAAEHSATFRRAIAEKLGVQP